MEKLKNSLVLKIIAYSLEFIFIATLIILLIIFSKNNRVLKNKNDNLLNMIEVYDDYFIMYDDYMNYELEIKELETSLRYIEHIHEIELQYANLPDSGEERYKMEKYIGYIIEYFEIIDDGDFEYWLYKKDKLIYEWAIG